MCLTSASGLRGDPFLLVLLVKVTYINPFFMAVKAVELNPGILVITFSE